jgi:hypothetical protein
VSFGTSAFGFPATVTLPGFVVLVLTVAAALRAGRRITSRNFMVCIVQRSSARLSR